MIITRNWTANFAKIALACATLAACDSLVRFRSDTIVCAKNGAGIQAIKIQERSGKKDLSFQRNNQVYKMELKTDTPGQISGRYKDLEIEIDTDAEELAIQAIFGNQFFKLNCASETSFTM